ncbi:MAG: ATP synthase F0 subunit A [Candidatus Kerfeldbacteria bacterium CG08_land_8_20_14_0_20_40_16]|uniref:ATP synthase subunit a n=1 Tax=Candidatus Kerfeldbacteria bacterium CG08_land_8_20_14_0_20_40_16 TaxID=2014244 RepID=A0A2H0YVI2_9BACT|nr:MAG: ATP synthase F0 subunit A [Candidatus Kerfeldbacteria bacterium CG08_land_8_20_14_0_20_40_16]
MDQQNQTENNVIGGEEINVSAASEQTSTGEQITHESTLYPEPVFHFSNFTITNSLLNSWVVVLLIILLSVIIKKKIKTIPRGIQNYAEMILESALNLADSVTGDRKKTMKIFPIAFAIFIFILLNNWLGIFPGIGSIGFVEHQGGEAIFVPFFRGSTADLNTTLGLALFAVIGSNLFGVVTIGFWKYFNKFINLKAFLEIPKKIKKEPTIIFVNPIKAFVGIIEIIGEVAKVASLSFRLFGNIFAGEVLLAAMAVIFAFVLPIPFMFLELIVGIIQALIFAMLTLVYFSIAATSEEH